MQVFLIFFHKNLNLFFQKFLYTMKNLRKLLIISKILKHKFKCIFAIHVVKHILNTSIFNKIYKFKAKNKLHRFIYIRKKAQILREIEEN